MRNQITHDPRWFQLITRDVSANGEFLYSVKTTGIYCLPSCSSPIPNSKNIRFYQNYKEAEQAGFRPCKRCNPKDRLLQDKNRMIKIIFGIQESSLGWVLAAQRIGKKGVCAVLFGETQDNLISDLQSYFPATQLIKNTVIFDKVLKKIITTIEDPTVKLSIPLDIQGTEFQQRVWHTLCHIPLGETWSYTKVATHLGLPTKFARAVAGACAANRIAIAIPCHRVVCSNGNLSGYRWGIERKRILLHQENIFSKRNLISNEPI
ncbi:methylated-DNA--[protein]-cysteine S-methyltransferase [Candidatus Nitrosacidococcus sp. I8]|uniref:methylated-DNA--[protein]-cysteine S-methyltransferase n=1 Tax=Candidatus Nitrosacidococcus sp. I8 TaxID=2942908 RepID=UPI002227F0B6|nr:methylated-DNA--[protein]-cysteine S-methyltransferase [Candidatus Nitrosacidococcus sp. I8]CAH9018150.1 Methylated-DNA--protein-cysteine methyltransferase [Candidatus Nitrosacidococcus sp. I8]